MLYDKADGVFHEKRRLPMWVFSRKRDESLVINDNIIVTVVEIRGDKVRLGIEHPPEVPVHRQEVLDAMRRQDAPAPSAPAEPPAPPKPHFSERQPDKIEKFVAALQARLAVPVDRDLVVQAMREAGIEEPAMKTVPK
jgi:carbon storage regulator